MALPEIHPWTLGGLIGAFIDLVLAYFLLCGSAFAFFSSKLLSFFGLCLPCPCKGIFGYRNSSFCVHKLLFECPLRKICSIQVMAVKRFPFDLIWVKGHSCNANEKVASERTCDNTNNYNRVVELEDDASCSSCSGPRLLSLIDKENLYDAKGKRIMSLKRRSGFRRRRRGTYDYAKISSVVPFDNLQSDVNPTSCVPCDGSIIRDRIGESKNPASGKEVSEHDAEDAQTSHDLDEKTCHSYEFSGSLVDSPRQDKCSSSLEHSTSNAQDNVKIVGSEENRIKMLETALEEEKAAYATLYLELEKERAAAATAADEAMAMISRLQEEKASMEMEMRQYQRIIEERVAYDEEEMDILQEILIRREMENHFLEKELEAYRQMDVQGSEQSCGKPKLQLDELGERPPILVETYQNPLLTESTESVVKKDEISNISSNYAAGEGEEPDKNTEHKDQPHNNLHSSVYDIEPDVLDVHVIDDNIELRDAENEKLSSSTVSTFSNGPANGYLELGSLTVKSSIASNFPRPTKTEIDNRCKTLPLVSGSGSSCTVHNEKSKIDNEIEILGERLRMLKHEKEKLAFFAENGESEKGRLKLLEEIANHLQQIKRMRNPVRGASLPPSSAKVSLRKRRCQSVSLEAYESS